MKAWRLAEPGGAFTFSDVPEPTVRPGSVLVRLQASPLLTYLKDFVEGGRNYPVPDGEFTPGTDGVGIIEQVGEDVYGLTPGQRVMLSPHLIVAENVAEPAEALIALFAAPQYAALLNTWRDGTLAELALAPAATVTPVPAELDDMPSLTLAALSRGIVPFGGLQRSRLAAGESIVIHGATGAYGSAAVRVAIAMGAGRVVAAGRNEQALDRLAELPRVRAVRMTGAIEADAQALHDAAGGGAHCALDMIGAADSANGTLATLRSLRRHGRLVLMGSMTVPLPLTYSEVMQNSKEVVGHFMYPRDSYRHLLELLAAGLLRLDDVPIESYQLADLEAAMRRAQEPNAPVVVMI